MNLKLKITFLLIITFMSSSVLSHSTRSLTNIQGQDYSFMHMSPQNYKLQLKFIQDAQNGGIPSGWAIDKNKDKQIILRKFFTFDFSSETVFCEILTPKLFSRIYKKSPKLSILSEVFLPTLKKEISNPQLRDKNSLTSHNDLHVVKSVLGLHYVCEINLSNVFKNL